MKETDVEWILKILHQRKDAILDFAFERRGDKLNDEAKELLSSGESLVGKDAVKLGIIDHAMNPDVYFLENLPKHDIGLVKPSLKQKIGLASTEFNLEEQDMMDYIEQLSF